MGSLLFHVGNVFKILTDLPSILVECRDSILNRIMVKGTEGVGNMRGEEWA
jgi:hypothetical protein